MSDTYALTKTVGSYSSGTRCEVMNFTRAHTAFVSIFATKEVIEVSIDDVVKLRNRAQVITLGQQVKSNNDDES